MGQKVHPHGFRLGYIYDWSSKWFADRNYTALLHEDLSIRRTISDLFPEAGVSRVEIERNANQVTVAIHTARPGIVIGRGGSRVDELRNKLEAVIGRRVRVNINEIRMPEIEAPLVAKAVAEQIERRVSHRRAIKQAAARAMQRGAQGVKIRVAGRLGGSDMSRNDQERQGRVPLHTLRADIDYGTAEARTKLGRIGVKAWIYKGDIIFERQTPARPGQSEEGETPATQAPAENAARETPATQAPAENAARETPAAQAPVEDAASEAPAAQAPVEDAASEAPAAQAPAEDADSGAPATQAPAENAAGEAPAPADSPQGEDADASA
jgi:small subunit ribosomal protein S3